MTSLRSTALFLSAAAALFSTSAAGQAPVSVSPSQGYGMSQSFSATYSDTNGYTDISFVGFLISRNGSAGNACYVYAYPQRHQMYLMNDAASGGLGPLTPGGNGSVSN